MGTNYARPPIEEAIVEFRFIPGQDWNFTIPGKLHEHSDIKRRYPGKPRTQKLIEASINNNANKPPNLEMREGTRFQLVDSETQRLISIGPDLLSINTLRPYDGWEQFRPRVVEALKAYDEVVEPSAISRIGVRYVNKIVIPESRIEFDRYFQNGLPSVHGIPNSVASFFSRIEYVYDDGIKLLLTQATVDASEEGSSAFVLDLDIIWEGEDPLALEAAMEIVDKLHKREGESFEAIITDALREVFNDA